MTAGQPLRGFRLSRLEVRNWGTFDDLVWTLRADGRNTLVTGDIGSGKSTIVDAITTLLLPANRISYNKAAGAETRERSLRSYVLGYYKSEQNEATGSTRPIALRDATKFSVILGVFTNAGYDATVTLAQVFWMKHGDVGGQPDRFYVTADTPLSIAGDFLEFGGDMARLRKRLKAADGVRLHDGFPEYGRDFRRRLGIESEQAMELFHQTVSMKSVGNLTDFVREHMLEPFNAAQATRDIVAHFEHLTSAHEAVLRARAQLAALTPLLADCDNHDSLAGEIVALNAKREALRYYFADHKARLLDGLLAQLDSERVRLTAHRKRLDERLADLRDQETGLNVERAGHGGNRLTEIERQIDESERTRADRTGRHQRFAELLRQAGLDPVMTAEQFTVRRRQIETEWRTVEQELNDSRNALSEATFTRKRLDDKAAEVNKEIRSLQQHKNNIPSQDLEVRALLCRELKLAEGTLPFAGELVMVRPEEADWEGAAERLLRGFALSVLVPEQHYAAVSDWINGHHLSGRIVYYRVPVAAAIAGSPPNVDGTTLAARLDVKPDSPFTRWLERELARRADVVCVETLAEFRREPKAITKAGQIKGGGGRHEKDDRFRIDDRRRYVLGWSNERKTGALLQQATELTGQIAGAANEEGKHQRAMDAAIKRQGILVGLEQTHDFSEIDFESTVNRIARLQADHAKLKETSARLAELDEQLTTVRQHIKDGGKTQSELDGKIGGLNASSANASKSLAEAQAILAEPESEPARPLFEAIRDLLAKDGQEPPQDASACDKAETRAGGAITAHADRRATARNKFAGRIASAMTSFRNAYPVETAELDSAVEAADGYRELHKRLAGDDLPRFQDQFKTYLNQNTIREIAQFQAQLIRQSDLIRERINTINGSLFDVDYNPGRYIRLEPQQTPNVEIRDFRADLRACTDDAVSAGTGSSGTGDDQYSEQKFLQVKRIIERFKGREGLTDADQKWTRQVTDVRNWYTFTASERFREDDSEYETYADSGGKSGGQKEKLAYTILAASFVYQFKLERDAAKSRTFRFVVIDEAFGRGSDESTRFALELFERLGLQLLIVTPLQKIHVIEPHVSAVGFVDNPTSRYSRLRTLTIEEYREERIARALGTPGAVAVA